MRIGYVSGDFRDHPVGYFLRPILHHHDRARFEIFCYDNASKADATTERLRASCDCWREIGRKTDEAAAKMIAYDEIDILVDLSGHTTRNRLGVFARKPAPVQAAWLGYWGTTGLPAIDYLIADATTIPPGSEGGFTERIARLPGIRFCYEPPDDAPRPNPRPAVERHPFATFGSFNNPNKLSKDVVRLWADVLQAARESRLLLKWRSLGDDGVRGRLRHAFSTFGIDPHRLIFRGHSPHADMLAEYDDVDVALDPFPFSGGLTSCEALWMGVPVVTLPGKWPHSRQTLGFLRALKLDECAAASERDYVSIAASLAGDHKRLEELRHGLRAGMAASPLCDGKTFTRELEAIFRKINGPIS